MKQLVVVMGVSGSGKTTIAQELAKRLGVPYAEADEFHSTANIEKMAAGVPLTDEDRWPWLRTIADWLRERGERGGVVTCSALKRSYRDLLREGDDRVLFVHPYAPKEVVAARVAAREDHFMPVSLLDSQYATLEVLQPDEPGFVLDASGTAADLVDQAVRRLETPA